MIIKNLKRIVAGIVMMTAVFSVNPIAAHAEWKQDSTGWWYSDGASWYIGWKQIDGKWYFFGTNGYMVHDHYVDNSYLNSEGYWDGSSQGFSVKYPSNWTKVTAPSGKILYFLDKETFVNSNTANMPESSRQKFIDGLVNKFKGEGADEANASQQVINGRTVDVLDLKIDASKLGTLSSNITGKVRIHQVFFYNNNKSYEFTLFEQNDISSTNMDSFNEMLKTVLF